MINLQEIAALAIARQMDPEAEANRIVVMAAAKTLDNVAERGQLENAGYIGKLHDSYGEDSIVGRLATKIAESRIDTLSNGRKQLTP